MRIIHFSENGPKSLKIGVATHLGQLGFIYIFSTALKCVLVHHYEIFDFLELIQEFLKASPWFLLVLMSH